jgi:Tfp pilus assembly protein PilE
MKKLFDWIVDKWLAGFITGSIFFVLKLYIDLPKESKTNFFSFEWLRELMAYQLSLMTVIIIVLSIIILTNLEKAIQKVKSKKSDSKFLAPPKNNFEKYYTDTFGIRKTRWTWNYKWNADKQEFNVFNLNPICNQCGTVMTLSSFFPHNSADCHKCRLEGRQYTFSVNEITFDIEKEIIRRIQNNEVEL